MARDFVIVTGVDIDGENSHQIAIPVDLIRDFHQEGDRVYVNWGNTAHLIDMPFEKFLNRLEWAEED